MRAVRTNAVPRNPLPPVTRMRIGFRSGTRSKQARRLAWLDETGDIQNGAVGHGATGERRHRLDRTRRTRMPTSRRVALCWAADLQSADTTDCRTRGPRRMPCRVQLGETADYKSALHPLAAANRSPIRLHRCSSVVSPLPRRHRTSASNGNCRSRSDSTGSGSGQAIPTAGSSQRRPRAASGT